MSIITILFILVNRLGQFPLFQKTPRGGFLLGKILYDSATVRVFASFNFTNIIERQIDHVDMDVRGRVLLGRQWRRWRF